jgi:hypothetical protein
VDENDECDPDQMAGRISLSPCEVHCLLTPVVW